MKRLLLMCAVGVLTSQVASASHIAAHVGPPPIGTGGTVLIDLGIWTPDAPTDPRTLGSCDVDGGSAEAELECLNESVIPTYNNAPGTINVLPATFGTPNIDVGGNLLSITLDVSNYDYLKLKWDGLWQYYYLGSQSGQVQFDSTVFNQNGQAQALSHYTFFSPTVQTVPDGGATFGLLGSALFGLGMFGRRKK